MNYLPFILDGFLLILFLVVWIISFSEPSYRASWRHFLRALSLPLLIGLAGHVIFALRLWEVATESTNPWLLYFTVFFMGCLFAFSPIVLLDLVYFIGSRLVPDEEQKDKV